MEQSSGRSWDFVGISREGWGLRDGTLPNGGKKTPPNRGKKHLQTGGKNTPPNRGKKTPPNKGKKHLQTGGKKHLQTRKKHLQTGKKNTSKQGKKTPPNKKKHLQTRKKHQQTRKIPFERGKRLSSKGYLPIKCKSLRVVGVSGQGKAVVSDGG